VAGCGDDEAGSGSDDGGVTPADITAINDQLDGLEDDLTGLSDNVDGLGDGLDELEGQVGDLEDALGGRLDALEMPEIISCSEEELCIPDGVDLTTDAIAEIVSLVCQHEIDCCNEDELNYKFGPGIDSVEDCETLFADLVNNGQTPDFLGGSPFIVRQVILVAQALNDPAVRIELNQDGIDACVESLGTLECPEWVEPSDEEIECVNPEEGEDDPCLISNLVIGLQEEGELCGDYGGYYYEVVNGVPECAEGLYCSHDGGSQRGICAQMPTEGDFCRYDDDCNPYYGGVVTNLFCNKATAECQELGDVGDPCEFIDPTFSFYSPEIDPLVDGAVATSIDCLPHLSCDPISDTCVNYCDAGRLCSRGGEYPVPCPGDLVCNVTSISGLWDNYGQGVCTEALEVGDEATYADECASGSLEYDVDEVGHCIPPLDEPGANCEGGAAGAADSLCSIGWCNDDEECAAPCNCEGAACDTWVKDIYGNDALECETGFYCDWGNNRGNGVFACEPKIANGQLCDTNGAVLHTSCTSGFCNTLSTPTANQCAAKQTNLIDAPCATTFDQECPANQYCNASNLCKGYVALDGDCNLVAVPAVECAPGLVCVDGASGDTCEEQAELGETCSVTPAVNPTCIAGLSCIDIDGGGTGTASECYDFLGTFENGVACAAYGDTVCASGWCAEALGVCAAKIAIGEPCDTEDTGLDVCDDGLYCNRTGEDSEGECAPQREPGQSCKPFLNGLDCRKDGLTGESSQCLFLNDQFVCDADAQPPESFFCDGN
jgi:hypothetical protein